MEASRQGLQHDQRARWLALELTSPVLKTEKEKVRRGHAAGASQGGTGREEFMLVVTQSVVVA